MTVATPVLLGTGTGPRTSPLQITSAAAVPAGSLIIIGTDGGVIPARPSTVIDSEGNGSGGSYSFIDELNTAPLGDPGITLWAAWVKTAISTTDTFTITYTGGTSSDTVNAIVMAVPAPSGLAVPSGSGLAGILDQSQAGFATGDNLVITTGQVGYAGELAVAYWSARQAQGAPQPGTDWNSIAGFQGQTNTHWVNMAWRIRSGTSTSGVVARAFTPADNGPGWGGVVATFIPLLVPAAQLSCGGTITPYHVSAVNGTATLGCGGSIPGPAETAPVAPPAQPVFPAGYGPLPGDFQNWVQQGFGYCTEGVVFRAEQHTPQSFPAATFTPLAFDTVLEDPWQGWSMAGTAGQAARSWLVPWTGVYRITFRYACASGNPNWNDPAVSVNGVLGWEGGGEFSPPNSFSWPAGGGDASFLLPLLAGDYVQLLAWSTQASNTDSGAGLCASAEITVVQTDLRSAAAGPAGTPGTYGSTYGPTY